MNQNLEQCVLDAIAAGLGQCIDEESLDLPMLPRVATEVLELVNDVDSDMASLATLIQSDPTLAGHVMRVANSSAFSTVAEMASLQQAISRLGMRNIADIALVASMGPAVFNTPGFESNLKDIWQSSMAIGIWSREIARQRRQSVEVAFLCGILLQIGKPAVLQASVDIAKQKHLTLNPLVAETLMKKYQAKVGIILAQQWRLPVAVIDTMYCLSGKQRADELNTPVNNNVDTVKAACQFAEMMLLNETMDAEALYTNRAIVDINFYQEDVELLLKKAEAVQESMAALMI